MTPKSIHVVALLSGVVLVLATGYLTYVNRGKAFGAGAFLAAIAIVFTLLASLGTETIRDHFTVTLVLDRATSLPQMKY